MSPPDITISLPLPSELEHPNARPHRQAKASAIKTTRSVARIIASQHRPVKPFAKAAYRVTFRLPRKRDYDGLLSWCKAQIDGLVDARILANDDEFRPLEIVRIVDKKQVGGKWGVTFEIWEEK
jgi:hypothetical protein